MDPVSLIIAVPLALVFLYLMVRLPLAIVGNLRAGHRFRQRLATSLEQLRLARMLGYFPGRRLGFGGREARTVIAQWAHSARTGSYTFPGFDGEALLAESDRPVHSIRLQGDFYAPDAAIRYLLDKVGSRRITEMTWDDPPHDGDHNRWPTDPDFVADQVAAFVVANP